MKNSYRNTSYKKITRCQNCGSVMSTRESFGFPATTCYPCEYTINHRGRAARHIIEMRKAAA